MCVKYYYYDFIYFSDSLALILPWPWTSMPRPISGGGQNAHSQYTMHWTLFKLHCMSTMCSVCAVCALCSVCTGQCVHFALYVHWKLYMCIPWTQKYVHRVANSFWHVAVCAESSPQLCIPEILENFQSRASSERTCFFWLHWALKRMYVWVNGILHFDLMINISCHINDH